MIVPSFKSTISGRPRWKAAGALLSAALAVAFAIFGYFLHFSLSAAEPVELLLVILVALRLGLFEASVTSVAAALSLDFLFTQPLFRFAMADVQNWIALLTFETVALFVSNLSSKVRKHAAQAQEQERRASTLYELSRSILYVQQQRPIGEQLSPIIRDLIGVDQVAFWSITEEAASGNAVSAGDLSEAAYQAYLLDRNVDDIEGRCSVRSLRLGVTLIGGMALGGWSPDPLMADAVASLAALAFERARANDQESRAQMARDAEQLRTAVLDGLAHGFKTPLTAIQAASSGLLAIGALSPMQSELVSIIDDRVTMLAQITTQLLRTAALDAGEIRLRRHTTRLAELIERVVHAQDAEVQARLRIESSPAPVEEDIDAPLVELALQQLLDNAVKYSAPETPVEIRIGRSAWETAITVCNASSAEFQITPEEKTRIFERFYRGNRDGYGPPGTGLGLSVVKKIAEAHGGRAWVECGETTTRFSFCVANVRRRP